MTSGIDDLISRANAGEAEAQRELAIKLHEGNGIARDEIAAAGWLRKAAEGGDAWSQTTYAINLRSTKDPENERQSVRWLALAAEQGDARARLTLGTQQFLGIGTDIDFESAAVNEIMASLSGFADASALFAKVKDSITPDAWKRIIERVRWANLMFIMGPPVDGYLDEAFGLFQQDKGDGKNAARWLKHEMELAGTLFLQKGQDEESILDAIFGVPVRLKKVSVATALLEGGAFASTTISLKDVVQADGIPVWWKPPRESIDAVMPRIDRLANRKWIRWSYMSL
jgi:hypothetical protein